jgi:uncharacterized membrane protein
LEQEFITTGNQGILLAIGLAIPFVSWIVGIYALKLLFVGAPRNLFGSEVPKGPLRVLIALFAGFGLFAFGTFAFLVVVVEPSESSFFVKLLACGGAVASFVYFVKPYRELYQTAAEIVKQRSALLDKCVERSAFS